jgi:hypothetical protein
MEKTMEYNDYEALGEIQQLWVARLIADGVFYRFEMDHQMHPLILADAFSEKCINTYLEHGTIDDARRAVKRLAAALDAYASDTETIQ